MLVKKKYLNIIKINWNTFSFPIAHILYKVSKDVCQQARNLDKEREREREDSPRKFRRFNYPLFTFSLEEALLAKRRNKTGLPHCHLVSIISFLWRNDKRLVKRLTGHEKPRYISMYLHTGLDSAIINIQVLIVFYAFVIGEINFKAERTNGTNDKILDTVNLSRVKLNFGIEIRMLSLNRITIRIYS